MLFVICRRTVQTSFSLYLGVKDLKFLLVKNIFILAIAFGIFLIRTATRNVRVYAHLAICNAISEFSAEKKETILQSRANIKCIPISLRLY